MADKSMHKEKSSESFLGIYSSNGKPVKNHLMKSEGWKILQSV